MRIKSKKRNSQPKKFLLPVILVVAAAVAVALVLQKQPIEPVQAEVVTYSTDTPDEIKPGDDFQWRGGPNDPKFIRLPSIGAEGYIQNVGIDQNQEVTVPNNVHFAGWFADSVLPGEKGLSIIDGHLNGLEEDGIFAHLENIKPGDTYTIEFGDGRTKEFRVTGVQTVDLKDAVNVLFSQSPTVSNQVNLITCGGDYDPSARLYDKRIIVSSELL